MELTTPRWPGNAGVAPRGPTHRSRAPWRSRDAQLIAPLWGMSSVGNGYDHSRRCPTHRALFEQVEDGTQGIALDFLLLLDALDREDAEVSVLAADLLLDVSAATIPPALHSIDVGELEDSNPIGQRCA